MKTAGIILILLLGVWLSAAETVRAVLFPFREAVIAARVDSRLQPYNFRIGQAFKKDAVLAVLDKEKFQLEYTRSKSQYEFALASFENKKRLRERNFTSDYELKKAEFEMRMNKTAMEETALALSYCDISAPFDGRIVEIMTREYEIVRPGQPLCRIIDDNFLLAVMNVPLSQKKLTSVGNKVEIKLDSGVVASGEIYEVFPQADHRTGTVRIRVKIDNRDGRLTSGMTGELHYGN